MIQALHAVVRDGRIEPTDPITFPEGTKLLVTRVDEDSAFWLNASQKSLEAIWDNSEDDRYAELLKE